MLCSRLISSCATRHSLETVAAVCAKDAELEVSGSSFPSSRGRTRTQGVPESKGDCVPGAVPVLLWHRFVQHIIPVQVGLEAVDMA